MEKKGNGLISLFLNVIFVIVIVLAGVITVVSLNTKRDVADIMGYIPFSIQTGSMEDTILKGDLIITERYESATSERELVVGDVISFRSIEQGQQIIKTHRIIRIEQTGSIIEYVTKGDNNPAEDEVKTAPGDIVSVYEGTRLPTVGYILDFFRSKWGFLFGIIVPIFLFFLYQLYVFVELFVEMKLETKRAKGSQ
jgi:signal peptidase I